MPNQQAPVKSGRTPKKAVKQVHTIDNLLNRRDIIGMLEHFRLDVVLGKNQLGRHHAQGLAVCARRGGVSLVHVARDHSRLCYGPHPQRLCAPELRDRPACDVPAA